MTNWDQRWLDAAKFYSGWSKDPSTQVGAIAVRDNDELSKGWNGFPRGLADTQERLGDRNLKLRLIVHAEANCIYNAGRKGVSLLGSTMYIHGLHVCSECAKACVQAGVKKVVMRYREMDYQRWAESCNLAQDIFTEAGVDWDSELIEDNT